MTTWPPWNWHKFWRQIIPWNIWVKLAKKMWTWIFRQKICEPAKFVEYHFRCQISRNWRSTFASTNESFTRWRKIHRRMSMFCHLKKLYEVCVCFANFNLRSRIGETSTAKIQRNTEVHKSSNKIFIKIFSFYTFFANFIQIFRQMIRCIIHQLNFHQLHSGDHMATLCLDGNDYTWTLYEALSLKTPLQTTPAWSQMSLECGLGRFRK